MQCRIDHITWISGRQEQWPRLAFVIYSKGVSNAWRCDHQKEREKYCHKEENHVAQPNGSQLMHAQTTHNHCMHTRILIPSIELSFRASQT